MGSKQRNVNPVEPPQPHHRWSEWLNKNNKCYHSCLTKWGASGLGSHSYNMILLAFKTGEAKSWKHSFLKDRLFFPHSFGLFLSIVMGSHKKGSQLLYVLLPPLTLFSSSSA